MFSKENELIMNEAFEIFNKEYLNAFLSKEEPEKITFSANFEKRMRKLIKRQKRFYYNWTDTAGKRAAAIIMAILASMTVTTVSVGAVRDKVVELVITAHEKFSEIVFNNEDMNTGAAFERLEPAYIPQGYQAVQSEFIENVSNIVIYEDGSGGSIMYDQYCSDAGALTVDNENTEYREITVNRLDGIIFEKHGHTNLIFGNENYVFSISATLSEEEVIKIAESIPTN